MCGVRGGKEVNAWVKGFQAFPEGEATVVLHAFCRSEFCGDDFPVSGWSDERWVNMIQDAIAEWNNVGAHFTFRTREVRPTDDPCNLPGAVVVILAPASGTCPGDGGGSYGGRTAWDWNVASPSSSRDIMTRIYVSVPWAYDHRSNTYEILVHEFGHVVGLGHPDEAGQNVQAIMNSGVNYSDLQPDDIAGIWALYGAPSETLTGFLENPGDRSSQSGVGIISGWVCEAEKVDIHIHTPQGNTLAFEAAYGTERSDTDYFCGDTDNGFSLLFNWNQLGDGEYTVVALVD